MIGTSIVFGLFSDLFYYGFAVLWSTYRIYFFAPEVRRITDFYLLWLQFFSWNVQYRVRQQYLHPSPQKFSPTKNDSKWLKMTQNVMFDISFIYYSYQGWENVFLKQNLYSIGCPHILHQTFKKWPLALFRHLESSNYHTKWTKL